jgi:hypothetical protein
METLVVSVSEDANKITGSIRAKLKEEDETKAIPIVEENMNGVDTFVSLAAGGYLITTSESAEALEHAQRLLIDKMTAFDYENQLSA